MNMRKRAGILGADGTLHGGTPFLSNLMPRVIPPKFSWISKNPTEICLTVIFALAIFLLPYTIFVSFIPLRSWLFGTVTNAILFTCAWRLGLVNAILTIVVPKFLWSLVADSPPATTPIATPISLAFWLSILEVSFASVFAIQKHKSSLLRTLGFSCAAKLIISFLIHWVIGSPFEESHVHHSSEVHSYFAASTSPLYLRYPISAIFEVIVTLLGALLFCQILRLRILSKIENALGLRLRRFGYRNTHFKLFDEIE
eukprot:TRINITY_DN2421_c0_g1_i1.p1 TRINITY_DN2421_c0_g1~~TRINITY_DN2421_c0_g1_i1.p1  ORF type:complete len:256 (-),score=15.33 TRINITY_DN2421_c0_g1_i1:28-795(-)